MGSSDIAKDKDYANFFMKKMGYKTVPHSKAFFSEKWGDTVGAQHQNIDDAYLHARKIGFPVIVKPNSGSQGSGVALVHTKQEFYKGVKAIFKSDRVVLVEQVVAGRDYRLVVLDKKVISAYERIPLNVVGDGKSPIQKLLIKKQKEFVTLGRDTFIKIEDPRVLVKLKHQQLNLQSVPNKGQKVYLLDNANLSSGGDSVDVTEKIHNGFNKLAIQLTADMGLRLCGVDLMVDGDISKAPDKYSILEINSAPGLDHYAKTGKEQEKVVEKLYLEVLKHIEK
jgi:D-alanine-D-alanine ligase-like ATP-grasp enzyme